MKKKILATLAAGFWITISEFVRNEFLFKSYWTSHYMDLGLDFQTTPLNGFLWLIWSILLAIVVTTLLEKFSMLKTLILSWISAFVMMWITIFNLQVLPLLLLLFAVPLSLLEIYLAIVIIKQLQEKLTPKKE